MNIDYFSSLTNGKMTNVLGTYDLKKLEIMMKNHIRLYQFSNKDFFNKSNNKNDIKFIPQNIVDNVYAKRYGLCMELNYAFGSALNAAGFRNYFVKCWKVNHTKSELYGIYHLAIIVMINNLKYFIDVGFGEYFTTPILIPQNLHDSFMTGSIKVARTIEYTLDVYHQPENKLIFKIIDLNDVTIEDINDNYINFFNAKDPDFPLCKYLFERIYNDKLNTYVEPKMISRL